MVKLSSWVLDWTAGLVALILEAYNASLVR